MELICLAWKQQYSFFLYIIMYKACCNSRTSATVAEIFCNVSVIIFLLTYSSWSIFLQKDSVYVLLPTVGTIAFIFVTVQLLWSNLTDTRTVFYSGSGFSNVTSWVNVYSVSVWWLLVKFCLCSWHFLNNTKHKQERWCI